MIDVVSFVLPPVLDLRVSHVISRISTRFAIFCEIDTAGSVDCVLLGVSSPEVSVFPCLFLLFLVFTIAVFQSFMLANQNKTPSFEMLSFSQCNMVRCMSRLPKLSKHTFPRRCVFSILLDLCFKFRCQRLSLDMSIF